MKAKSKRHQTRGSKHQESGVFVVPSYGRLARRGSTEVVRDAPESDEAPRSLRDSVSYGS